MGNRIQRVNSLIKNELSKIFLRELDFPNDILVTITRVETSVDLNQARVYISVMPAGQIDRVFEVLSKGIYDIQQKLNKRLKMRPIPKIKFEREEKTKEAGRVEELLEEIKENEENG
jgi:ribosome-binding factor A